MTEPPPLTVALPTYQGARHLGDALRSILGQGGVPFDLVVCDDRSEDDTIAIVRELTGDRARIEVNSERLGLAGNWNRCVERSRTPLVAVFHQDDVMRPGHLAAAVRALADPGVGMAFSAFGVIDADGRPVPPDRIERPDFGPADLVFPPGTFARELAASNPVRCSAVTLRKAAHQQAGGFDPAYRYAVDWEFWLRLSRQWSVARLAAPTVDVRWHPGSETHRFKRGTADLDEVGRLQAELFRRDSASLPDAPRLRREADRRLARAYLNRSYEALRAGDRPLARRALGRAWRLWPGIAGVIARDPRLAARLAALVIRPGRGS